jgi:hypothetical protein
MSRHKNFATLYKWIRQAKEVIFLLVSLLAYIYSDEIKSFISKLGEEISVDPLKIIFLALIVLAAVILLYRVISFWRSRKKPAIEFGEKHIEGIEFFTSREELRKKYPLKDFLSQAKQRIVILGGSLESIVVQNRKTIWEILDQRILIEFILQNPSWVSSTKLSKEIAFTPLEGGIARSLGVLCSIKNELDASKKSGCVIKTYEVHATYSGIIIDPDSPESKVLVELYPYDTQAESRPIVVIHRKENEALFKTWWHSCESVSGKAKEYTCPEQVKEPMKNERGSEKPEYDLISFDRSFKALQEVSEPRAKATMLDHFQPKLRSLCYDYDWKEVEDRIEEVLEYMPEKLSNDPHALNYLQYLAMIINRYSEHTRDAIREKWLDELEDLYNDPKYETNSNILEVLQELHQYSKECLMKLIDDSATRWGDQRFQNLASHIDLKELKKRNEAAFTEILGNLRRKMNEADRNKEEKAFERLKFLYQIATR